MATGFGGRPTSVLILPTGPASTSPSGPPLIVLGKPSGGSDGRGQLVVYAIPSLDAASDPTPALLTSIDFSTAGLSAAIHSEDTVPQFGAALADLGDVEGYGFRTIAVGSPGFGGGQGAVFLLHFTNCTATTCQTLSAPSGTGANDEFMLTATTRLALTDYALTAAPGGSAIGRGLFDFGAALAVLPPTSVAAQGPSAGRYSDASYSAPSHPQAAVLVHLPRLIVAAPGAGPQGRLFLLHIGVSGQVAAVAELPFAGATLPNFGAASLKSSAVLSHFALSAWAVPNPLEPGVEDIYLLLGQPGAGSRGGVLFFRFETGFTEVQDLDLSGALLQPGISGRFGIDSPEASLNPAPPVQCLLTGVGVLQNPGVPGRLGISLGTAGFGWEEPATLDAMFGSEYMITPRLIIGLSGRTSLPLYATPVFVDNGEQRTAEDVAVMDCELLEYEALDTLLVPVANALTEGKQVVDILSPVAAPAGSGLATLVTISDAGMDPALDAWHGALVTLDIGGESMLWCGSVHLRSHAQNDPPLHYSLPLVQPMTSPLAPLHLGAEPFRWHAKGRPPLSPLAAFLGFGLPWIIAWATAAELYHSIKAVVMVRQHRQRVLSSSFPRHLLSSFPFAASFINGCLQCPFHCPVLGKRFCRRCGIRDGRLWIFQRGEGCRFGHASQWGGHGSAPCRWNSRQRSH